MYQAKESGRNTECFFDAAVNRKALRKLKLERHLRSTLEQQEFELYYQPVYDVSDNRIIGAEALLRWNSQALGTVSNEEYIPVAEQTGLIVDIGL